MNHYTIEQIYQAYTSLSKPQRKELITKLRSLGLPLNKIEAYVYSEAPGIKHIFCHFDKNPESIPYFMLDSETWSVIHNEIMSFSDKHQ